MLKNQILKYLTLKLMAIQKIWMVKQVYKLAKIQFITWWKKIPGNKDNDQKISQEFNIYSIISGNKNYKSKININLPNPEQNIIGICLSTKNIKEKKL